MKSKYFLIIIIILSFGLSASCQYSGNDTQLAMSDETEVVKNIPCKISYLKILPDSIENVINWQAVGEDVNSNFYIERSKDGINYETIGIVESNNDKNINKTIQPKEYSFIDKTELSGTTYYTIRYEGSIGTLYSKAIKIER